MKITCFEIIVYCMAFILLHLEGNYSPCAHTLLLMIASFHTIKASKHELHTTQIYSFISDA